MRHRRNYQRIHCHNVVRRIQLVPKASSAGPQGLKPTFQLVLAARLKPSPSQNHVASSTRVATWRIETLTLSQKARQGWGTQKTLVFDEIDTGIGGRAAEAVGKKLKQLARSNQVLCVTHLPQIATFADHHYVIEKKESGGRTRTSIRAVEGEERTEEVARMLSGAKLTETSRKHAEQMIKANA